MPTATEIVFLQLKEGINLEDTTSSEAELWKKCVQVIAAQPGFERMYWGVKVEDPKIAVATIDWKDVQDHKNFVNADVYKPFTADLANIFDFDVMLPFYYHVNLTSDSVAAREAPATEFAPFQLAADAGSGKMSELEDNVLNLTQGAKEKLGCLSYASGWAFEEQEHPESPNKQAKVLQCLLGWNSVEDHMKAREAPEFPGLVQPVRAMLLPPLQGKVWQPMFHVKLHKTQS